MTDDKKNTLKEVETTMACSAYAEAGEPCPIDAGSGEAKADAGEKEKKAPLESVGKDFACTAFHDQNLDCPIDEDKK